METNHQPKKSVVNLANGSKKHRDDNEQGMSRSPNRSGLWPETEPAKANRLLQEVMREESVPTGLHVRSPTPHEFDSVVAVRVGKGGRRGRHGLLREIPTDEALEFGQQLPVDEDEQHEFKSLRHTENLLKTVTLLSIKYINSFLNADGGSIYFGVEDDGRVVGMEMPRDRRDALRLMLDSRLEASIVPPLDPSLVRLQFIPVLHNASRESASSMGQSLLIQHREMKKRGSSEYHRGDPLFVLRISTRAGRSPVYFVRYREEYVAFVRRLGSTKAMSRDLVRERLRLGRPQTPGGPSRPPLYVGKATLLAEVREFVLDDSTPTHLKVVAVHGVPGVGKSAFAQRLVDDLHSIYFDPPVFVNMKGTAAAYMTLELAMVGVIRYVMPEVALPREPRPNPSTTEEQVHDAFMTELGALYERCFAGKRVILVLENVRDFEQVRALVPHSADMLLVVVTSRFAFEPLAVTFSGATSHVVRLEPLGEASAVALLRTFVPDVADAAAAEIVRLCGHLPLTIRVIGATLKSDRRLTPELLAERLRDPRNQQELLQNSFRLAGEEMAAEPEALNALYAAALFPATFDLLALASVLDVSYEQAEAFVTRARHLNFVDPADGDRFTMNDVVRTYWRNEAEEHAADLVRAMKDRFFEYFLVVLLEFREEVGVERCDVNHAAARGVWKRFWVDRENFEVCFEYCQLSEKPKLAALYQEVMDDILRVWQSPSCGRLRDSFNQVPDLATTLPQSVSLDDLRAEYDVPSISFAMDHMSENPDRFFDNLSDSPD